MGISYRGDDRRRESAGWRGPERRSRFAAGSAGQLLEEGAAPSGPTSPLEDSANVEATLGSGTFEGPTAGARGHEGVDFPGEHTWGEEEAERERRE